MRDDLPLDQHPLCDDHWRPIMSLSEVDCPRCGRQMSGGCVVCGTCSLELGRCVLDGNPMTHRWGDAVQRQRDQEDHA